MGQQLRKRYINRYTIPATLGLITIALLLIAHYVPVDSASIYGCSGSVPKVKARHSIIAGEKPEFDRIKKIPSSWPSDLQLCFTSSTKTDLYIL